jgi:hypothetical protein
MGTVDARFIALAGLHVTGFGGMADHRFNAS